MDWWDMLGLAAHRGGLIALDPTLTVGVVQVVARSSELQVEVIARQPLDRRSADQRHEGIRTMAAITVPSQRHLLPAHDEGIDLRLGWLDRSGRPHWEYPVHSSGSSGDAADGQLGPCTQSTYVLLAHYESATLVLAWPEIGFPESTVTMALPDRLSVERATISIWDAPLPASRAPTWESTTAESAPRGICYEDGTILTSPQGAFGGDGFQLP